MSKASPRAGLLRTMLVLSIPTVLEEVLTALLQYVDTAMVGRLVLYDCGQCMQSRFVCGSVFKEAKPGTAAEFVREMYHELLQKRRC